MTIDEAKPGISLRAVTERLYPIVIAKSIEEAEQLESVGVEITMLRAWLNETIQEEERDKSLMVKVFRLIVQAVAVKYRLGPKSTEQLLTAVTKALRYTTEQLKEEEV